MLFYLCTTLNDNIIVIVFHNSAQPVTQVIHSLHSETIGLQFEKKNFTIKMIEVHEDSHVLDSSTYPL